MITSAADYKLILDELHYPVFLKDTSSRFLWANKSFCFVAGIKDQKIIVGLSDYDLPWTRDQSNGYRKNDNAIIKSNTPQLNHIEKLTAAKGIQKIILINKSPFYDSTKELIGIVGQFSIVNKQNKNDHLNSALFTEKQQNCLMLLIQGKTIKAIARRLNIAPSTVACHLDAIKKKLNCQYKSELIEKAINMFYDGF